MSAYLSSLWSTGYPKSDGNTCVAFKYLKLVTVPCNSSTFYYDNGNDGDPTTTTKPLLGYLCETRLMTTASGTDTCYFPFQYQGKTYSSCSLENNTLINSNGAPWCMTDVRMLFYLTIRNLFIIFISHCVTDIIRKALALPRWTHHNLHW